MDPTGTYHGDSDLQLERVNVYFNEASGGEPWGVSTAKGILASQYCCLLGTNSHNYEQRQQFSQLELNNPTLQQEC